MANYTNIKDILKQFELQIVQAKHYKKDEVYTKSQTNTAISNAIAGVNQFNIVKSSSAANTPKGVVWRVDSTNSITGTLEASAADKHTIYYVPSVNGAEDRYDEYMALTTGSSTYVWEKIGNTDIDLSGYVPTTRKINGNALTSDITLTKNNIGLGNVTNTATESTITENSGKNITSGAVYAALNKSVSSSSNGITLGGKVNAPTISVDITGDIAAGSSKVAVSAQVYSFVTEYAQPKDADLTAIAALTGTHGFLKKTATDTWTLDTEAYLTTTNAADTYVSKTYAASTFISNKAADAKYLSKDTASSTYLSKTDASDTYLTKSDATRTYATNATAVGDVEFNSSKGLRYKTLDKLSSTADSDYNVIANINTLKSGLGIKDKANKTDAISASNSGVALGGTVSSPTITVTGGSVAAGNGSVVKGATVYDYISGSSGVLYMTDDDFTSILNAV